MFEGELFDYDPMVGIGYRDGAVKTYSDQIAFLMSRAVNLGKQEATREMSKDLTMGNLDEYVSEKYKRQMKLTAHQDWGGRAPQKRGKGLSPCGQHVGSGSISKYVFNPADIGRMHTKR